MIKEITISFRYNDEDNHIQDEAVLIGYLKEGVNELVNVDGNEIAVLVI